ncbi:MAG: hypothetical protein SGJ10_09405 [Bacteroidota bacterium]|nr:hypothetical protein [Bacteroidota bacterium]
MKKLIYIITILLLWSCGEKNEQPKMNSEAQLYFDSAMMLTATEGIGSYDKAIQLLDKATDLDTNFTMAYWEKLTLLGDLKRYDKALITAQHLIRANSSNPDIYVRAGMMCYRLGDSISANKYYNTGLELYNKYFDTLSTKSENYDMLLMNKGITLVLLGKDKEGNEALKNIYNRQTDSTNKKALLGFMNKSKDEILDTYQPR